MLCLKVVSHSDVFWVLGNRLLEDRKRTKRKKMNKIQKFLYSLSRSTAPEAVLLKPLQLMVTLWPSFGHFRKFANDSRLSGIRLNSAMINNPELEAELKALKTFGPTVPLFFDAKGWQMRGKWVDESNTNNIHKRLNHPISLITPDQSFIQSWGR